MDEFRDLGDDVFGDDWDDEGEEAEEEEEVAPIPIRGRSVNKVLPKPAPPPPRPPARPAAKSKPSPIVKASSRELLIHPWSAACVNVLDKTFHLKRFRPNQLEAINGTLSGKDVFVLMPTGGGKSLCYQLPSQVSSGKTSGVTIVVSPLISLINDQVAHLEKLCINAIPFTSDLPAQDKKRAIQILNGGPSGNDSIDGWIVYVTPEMLSKSTGFQSLLRQIYRKGKLARFVIDEAHCVSSVCAFRSISSSAIQLTLIVSPS